LRCYDADVTTSPWQPSRPLALFIGVLSVWPIVYFFLFMASMVFMFTSAGTRSPLFASIFVLHVLTMLLIFALMAVYVFHAFNTDRIANDRRVLWVLVLLLGGLIAFPIYWYLYMWRPDSSSAVSGSDSMEPPRT
jgi:threonine/homoserine/homoserine lactone efflux protein